MEIAFLATGVLAGLLAGLFGVGGGLIIVPALFFIFPQLNISPGIIMHLALGTSLATIVVTSISSAYSHYRHGAILMQVALRLTPGLVIGAFLAGTIADRLRSDVLTIGFVVFELLVVLQLLTAFQVKGDKQLPRTPALVAGGAGIGVVSGLVGIGGGTLTVPYLSWYGVSIKNAIATSAACGFPIALGGMIGFMLAGWNESVLPKYSTGYIYWPAFLLISLSSVLCAPLGARLAHRLPALLLKRLFALLLAVVSIKMLVSLYN